MLAIVMKYHPKGVVMIIILFLLLISSPSFITAESTPIQFDDAMKKKDFPHVYELTEQIMGVNGVALYNFFKATYEKNISLMFKTNATNKTPKKIHQIWLGSPLPEAFKQLQQSWIKHHAGPEWVYKLWTDEDVAQMQLYNQKYYDATDNYGVKADILRLEILYQYGGIYADMDCECLRSFDDLLCYDFFTGLQPLDSLFVQLGNALVASRPGHPILKHCIETIKDDWHLKGAPTKTGPVHFTKSFCAMVNKDNNIDIALPAFYFNPLGCREQVTEQDYNQWVAQGAYAVHRWAKSWMPKEYRPASFRDINNDLSAKSWND